MRKFGGGGGGKIACTEKARETIVYCAFVGCTASKSGRMNIKGGEKLRGKVALYRKGMKMIVYCAFVGCAARSPGRVCIKGRGGNSLCQLVMAFYLHRFWRGCVSLEFTRCSPLQNLRRNHPPQPPLAVT